MKILQKVTLPLYSVNDEEVIIVTQYFNDGDFVKKNEVILEFETSKALVSMESEVDGYIFYNFKEGDSVLVGTVVAEIYDIKKGNIKQEKPIESNKGNNDKLKIVKTIFSEKAKSLLKTSQISESIFEGQDFVNHDDVLLFLNNNTKDFSLPKEFNPINQLSFQNITEKQDDQNNITTNSKFENNKERIVIICPSKIGMEVIWDIIEGQKNIEIVGYVVDDKYKSETNLPFLNCNVFDFPLRISKEKYDSVIIAMGGSLKSMQFRKRVFDSYKNEGIKFTNFISKKANIGINCRIGEGNIIGSGVYIGTGSSIGDNNFISYMTTIGHHNIIGNNNLFAPGVMMSGLVEVGDDCILTTGVNFIDKVKIGDRIILPLGYCVISNIASDTIIKMRSNI